jgi:hypothetical protein
VDFINGKLTRAKSCTAVETSGNISFVIPQRLRDDCTEASFFMRVKTPADKAKLTASCGGAPLLQKTCAHIAPPEMLAFDLEGRTSGALTVTVKNEEVSA